MPFFLVTRTDISVNGKEHLSVAIDVVPLSLGSQHLVCETNADVVVVIQIDKVEIIVTESEDPDNQVNFPSSLFGDDACLGSLKHGGIQLESFVLYVTADHKEVETMLYFQSLTRPTVSLEWHDVVPSIVTLSSLL